METCTQIVNDGKNVCGEPVEFEVAMAFTGKRYRVCRKDAEWLMGNGGKHLSPSLTPLAAQEIK